VVHCGWPKALLEGGGSFGTLCASREAAEVSQGVPGLGALPGRVPPPAALRTWSVPAPGSAGSRQTWLKHRRGLVPRGTNGEPPVPSRAPAHLCRCTLVASVYLCVFLQALSLPRSAENVSSSSCAAAPRWLGAPEGFRVCSCGLSGQKGWDCSRPGMFWFEWGVVFFFLHCPCKVICASCHAMPSDLSSFPPSIPRVETPPSLPGHLQATGAPLGCPEPCSANVLGNSSSSTFLKSCVLHAASMFVGRPLEWLGGIYQVQIHLTEKQNSSVILTSCGGRVKERERRGAGAREGRWERGGAASGLLRAACVPRGAPRGLGTGALGVCPAPLRCPGR